MPMAYRKLPGEQEKLRCEPKADFQSVEFSERAEILLLAEENVVLKLKK